MVLNIENYNYKTKEKLLIYRGFGFKCFHGEKHKWKKKKENADFCLLGFFVCLFVFSYLFTEVERKPSGKNNDWLNNFLPQMGVAAKSRNLSESSVAKWLVKHLL